MSEQRIELWALCNSVGLVGTYGPACEQFVRDLAVAHDLHVLRLVEIREGERITGPGESAPWSVVDEARKERDAAIERAKKAEAALNDLRESYLMESISVDLGARAQFERETAARLLAAEYGAPDDEISFENAIEVESYWQRRAMWAKRTASFLADACFGAKEAKG